MDLRLWLQPPRRSLGVFLAMSLGLTAGLAWFGWQVVELDRNLERQRTQERVGHAIDLVAVSLGRWLDDVGRELAIVAAAPDGVTFDSRTIDAPDSDAPVFLVFTRDGLRAVPEGRLAYYPDEPSGVPHASAASATQTTRASALLLEAASLNRAGRHDAALAAYDRLAALTVTVPVLDAPAPIVARHARAQIFDVLGRRDDLRSEADRLWEAVHNSDRRLTRGVYRYYSEQARLWSGREELDPAEDAAESMRLARAAIASDLVESWRRDAAPASGPETRTVRVAGEPMLVIERRVSEALAAFVAPARLLGTEVRRALDPDAQRRCRMMIAGSTWPGATSRMAPSRSSSPLTWPVAGIGSSRVCHPASAIRRTLSSVPVERHWPSESQGATTGAMPGSSR
jgi:hypothetical protein